MLIIGAGETAELTARALSEQGVSTMFVANRRRERAIALARRFGGATIAFDALPARARAGRHRRRLDRLAARDRRRRGARARHRGARRPAAAAARPRRAARHRPECARAARRHARRHRRPAGAGRRARTPSAGSRRAAPRASSRRRSSRFAGWLGTLEVLPTIAALREQADGLVAAAAGRERAPLGEPRRARPRARRGDAARGRQAAAARADAARQGARQRAPPRAPVAAARAVRARRAGGGAERRRRPRCASSAPLSALRLGTRGSALALAQARWVAERLPGEVGDRRDHHARATATARRGRQVALDRRARARRCVAGEIDLAVHSAKDVPGELADGTAIVAVPPRADPRDVLVGAPSLDALPAGARVGTSALRRRAQLLAVRPGPRRGRAARQRRHAAAQARRRRGRRARARRRRAGAARARRRRGGAARRAPCSCPPPGQGALAAAGARGRPCFDAVDDPASHCGAARPSAPSSARLGASCHTPVGVHRGARRAASRFVGLPDGSEWLVDEAADAGRARRADARRGRRRAARARRGGGVSTGHGLPRRRGAGRPRAADRARRRADRARRRDPPRPADPRRGARRRAAGRRAALRRQGGRRRAGPAGGDPPAAASSARARAATSCGSRAATRSCSAAAARRRSSASRPGSRSRSCPGVTAGVAAPAYAGIPVTHRELASAVAFVTGHEDPAKPETALDWPALAAFPGTLVFYMGVRALPRIAERLIAGGRPADEPVAVVERGTLPGQRTLLATLGDVAERAAAESIRAPAITLVGPVAALREQIALARAAAAARAHDRRHARARAGERAGRAAARARRRGRRGAGDPDAAARRRAARPRRATT